MLSDDAGITGQLCNYNQSTIYLLFVNAASIAGGGDWGEYNHCTPNVGMVGYFRLGANYLEWWLFEGFTFYIDFIH